ncbi:MAG: ribosome maturation factor RimP [Legionellales bacterium]|nr:MAG: ribosome maturation factor RimP [Legionellales bacterium]
MQQHQELEGIIVPIVTAASLEFVGIEVVPQAKSTLLRLYIDNPAAGGVTADDCGRIAKRVSMELSVTEGHKSKTYIMEVSSPGLDRILFNAAQLAAHCGKKVKVKLQRPSDTGKRNIIGTLKSSDDTGVTIIDDVGVEHSAAFSNIGKVRLVPEW